MSDFKKGDKCLLFTTKCIVKKVYHESQEALINDYGDFYDRADFDELALDPEPLLNKIAELEQQLSNSISKDELRGLVDELRAIENRDNNPRDQHLVGASLGAGMAANKLNKLIEGDNNG